MGNGVLFVAMLNPFLTGGGSQATRAYLDATLEVFGRENVDIMTNEGVVIPSQYKDVHFIFVPQRHKLLAYFLFPFGVLGRFAKAATKQLNDNEGEYSYCIFNGGMESGWCFKHIKSSKVKKVTIHHNQEVKYNMDMKTVLTLGGRWPYTLRVVERNAYKYSDYNFFLTQQDLDEMEKDYGRTDAKNRLIGTFDYKDAPTIYPGHSEKDFHIVASGTMAHFQTTHGILDFYNRYFPIACRIIPNLKILLTGRNPSAEIKALEEKSHHVISIIPNPEDIMKRVQHGSIFLCPTNIGSGLKLRAMDGLKCGLPILTHEVSARGYDYFYNKPYYRIYHDEKTFEEGLNDLLNYIKDNPNSVLSINNDYYEYFGFNKGLLRFRDALDQ